MEIMFWSRLGHNTSIEVRPLHFMVPIEDAQDTYYEREHIYRRHPLPIRCARCGRQFDTEAAMQKHSKEPVPCQVSEAEEADGYSKEQEKQLRGRKKPPNQTEEDRWTEMFRILFPNDDHASMPSPCRFFAANLQLQLIFD
jgi:hypothetical protein